MFPKEIVKNAIKDFPKNRQATHILAYGYIDHEAGLTIDVLCCCDATGGEIAFYPVNPESRVIRRIRTDEDIEYSLKMTSKRNDT